jgi:GxxExxY protein
MKPVKKPIFYEDLTYKIIGCAMRIHTELGPIHKEVVYQRALETELGNINMKFDREVRVPVKYRDKNIGVYVPDFVIDNKVVVEIKALPFIPEGAETQLSYYLKVTGFKIGLLINFGFSKLQVKRRVYG